VSNVRGPSPREVHGVKKDDWAFTIRGGLLLASSHDLLVLRKYGLLDHVARFSVNRKMQYPADRPRSASYWEMI
jgi:hypothetical protein